MGVAKMLMHTDLGKVQLGPSDDHSAFSSLFRCSWRKETAPAVMAGLSTDPAMAGPPVVLTICQSTTAVSVAKKKAKCGRRQEVSSTPRTHQVEGHKDGMHQLRCVRLRNIRLESCLKREIFHCVCFYSGIFIEIIILIII